MAIAVHEIEAIDQSEEREKARERSTRGLISEGDRHEVRDLEAFPVLEYKEGGLGCRFGAHRTSIT